MSLDRDIEAMVPIVNERRRVVRNKFAGKCIACGESVPAGAGHPERKSGRWAVRCLKCVDKPTISWMKENVTVDEMMDHLSGGGSSNKR